MPNPLAIGVTLGGLLLDVVVPRPKPRVGLPHELSPVSDHPGSRTPWRPAAGSGVRASVDRERVF
jgi:hypothetical protein